MTAFTSPLRTVAKVTTKTAVAPVVTAGMSTAALAAAKQAVPSPLLSRIGWVTPARRLLDRTPEVYETTLASAQLINWVSFDIAHYPQTVRIEALVGSTWQTLVSNTEELIEVTVSTSVPKVIPSSATIVNGSHPQHPLDASHWLHYEFDLSAVTTTAVRIVMTRNPLGDPPLSSIDQVTLGGKTVAPARPLSWATTLRNGLLMRVGDVLRSPSGLHTLEVQNDANLVLRKAGKAVWSSNTAVAEPGPTEVGTALTMQADGNLVLRSTDGKTIWQSGTSGAGSTAALSVTDDGDAQVRRSGALTGTTTTSWSALHSIAVHPLPASALPTDPPGNNYGAIETTTAASVTAYTLALSNVQLAYKIDSFADASVAVTPEQAAEGVTNPIITSYTDSLGGQVGVRKNVRAAASLIDGSGGVWMSRPQPAIDAVVCLYADMRQPDGTGVVLDRFLVDPVTTGVVVNLYYSTDPPPDPSLDPGESAFYEGMFWYPISRDYVLQKGYLDVPPTLATFWKLEFTGLVAQPNYSLDAAGEPVQYKVHPGGSRPATSAPGYQPYDQSAVPGLKTAQTLGASTAVASTYADQKALPAASASAGAISPTASLWTRSPAVRAVLRRLSPVFGSVQVHAAPSSPTRFTQPGQHVYQVVQALQTDTIGYYVGLNSLEAYRLDFTADDNTAEYVDHFADLGNLASCGFQHQPGALTMADSQVVAQAVSNSFGSSREVVALQFAATQSDAPQLLPDQQFADPTQWVPVGDASLSYQPATDPTQGSALVVARAGGASGGAQAQPVYASSGRLHAACRAHADQDLGGVLVLQVLDGLGRPIASSSAAVNGGQTVEWTCDVTPAVNAGPFTAQVFQAGQTTDTFEVQALSLFQDGLTWEFSTDGGVTWTTAYDINCNPHGVLVFDRPGTSLAYRVTALHAHQFVSSLSIRPWYAGLLSGVLPRTGLVAGGPNLNLSDHYAPIEQDPAWQQWGLPVPRSWYLAGKAAASPAS